MENIPTNNAKSSLVIRPYSKQELCNLYGVSNKVLLTWMKPFVKRIGERKGIYYTINQVRMIFELLGVPEDAE